MPPLATQLAHTVRALRRRPVFSALTLTLLALSTAAVAAIFAVVDATLLRPLPYRDPAALFAIPTTEPVNADSLQEIASAPIEVARWRERSRTFESVEAYTPVTLDLSGDGDPEAIRGHAITAGLLTLLGTPPALGRTFRRDEEAPSSGVVILGDALATRRFGAAERAVGKRMVLDGEPRTVIGVMPPGFSLLFQGGDAWVPADLTVAQQQSKARLRIFAAYGRLRGGATRAQALADLASIDADLRAEHPDDFRYTGVRVTPLRESLFGDRRASMIVLLGAVVLVLLIAGANVGNLVVADVIARRTMTMTRLAMGASRSSVVALRAQEMLVLVVAATVAGLLAAHGVLALFIAIDPLPFVPLGGHWMTVAVVVVAALAAALVGFGATMPAAFAEARVSIGAIAGGASRSAARGDRRLRQWLTASQVATTVVLLCGAALLGRDFVRLMATSPGFDRSGVLAVQLNISAREHPTSTDRAQYVSDIVRAVRAVPGVDGASTIQTRFVLNETMQTAFEIDGRPPAVGVQQLAQIRHVMPDVFRVMHIRVVQGRGIDSTDRDGAAPVAAVSASFARTYWPNESAMGKRLRRVGNTTRPWLTVVGVVDDIMDAGAGVTIGPTMYVPYLQQNTPTARVTLVVRTRSDPAAFGSSVRRAVWSVNPVQAIDDVSSLETLLSRSAAQPRFQTLVVAAFGASAMLLVLAGVYALTLFSVLARMRELGIRSALGATPAEIVTLTMRGSLAPVVAGATVGALAAIPVTRAMQRVVHARLEVGDAIIIGGVLAALIGAAAVAAYLPARRAGRGTVAGMLRA